MVENSIVKHKNYLWLRWCLKLRYYRKQFGNYFVSQYHKTCYRKKGYEFSCRRCQCIWWYHLFVQHIHSMRKDSSYHYVKVKRLSFIYIIQRCVYKTSLRTHSRRQNILHRCNTILPGFKFTFVLLLCYR